MKPLASINCTGHLINSMLMMSDVKLLISSQLNVKK